MALQVWLPLNGNIKNQGLSNITVTNNGATVNDNGKIGKCYSFDGSDDFISLSGQGLYNIFKGGNYEFSITTWIYHADATRAIIFGDYNLSGNIAFNIELSTSHAFRFYWGGNPDKTFNGTLTLATWTHIAITYNGSKLIYYKDGIKTDELSVTLASKNKTSGSFYLGRDSRTGATALNGRLNDFRIYDHALSAKEVKELSKGLILHYPLEGNPLGNLEFYDYIKGDGNSWIDTLIPYDSTKTSYKVECKFSLSPNVSSYDAVFGAYTDENSKCLRIIRGNNNSKMWLYYNSKAGGGVLATFSTANSNVKEISITSTTAVLKELGNTTTYTYSNYTGNNTTSKFYLFCQGIVNGSVSCRSYTALYYWRIYDNNTLIANFIPCTYNGTPGMWDTVEGKFYGNNGTGTFTLGNKINVNNFTSDCSGYNNNGTITGTLTLSNDTPRYNCSTVFDGSTNNIVTSFPSYSNTATFCIWAKFSKFEVHLLDCRNALEIGYLPMYIKSTGVLVGGTSTSFLYINYSFSLNTWYHLVVVYKSDKTELYVNGNYIGNNTSAKGYNYSQILPLYIGSRCSGINKFLGLVSDFRVYVNALSANDILELYNTSAYIYSSDRIASYKFIEGGEVLNITSLGTVISASYEEDETPVTFGDNYINSKEFIEI